MRPQPGYRALLLVASACASTAQATEPSYVVVERVAQDLERRGEHARAAETLERLAQSYSQDYQLHVNVGRLFAKASRFAEAADAWRRALAITPSSVEARLGLGWALLGAGQHDAAEREFRAVLRLEPKNASAQGGLEASQRAPTLAVTPAVSVTFHSYQAREPRPWAMGLALALPATIRGVALVELDYRLTHVDPPGAAVTAVPLAAADPPSFRQHEVYLGLGTALRRFGATGHYGLIHDGSPTGGTGHILGASLRWSPWGDIVLESSASLYPAMQVFRTCPSWHIPLGDALWIVPALALQVVTRDAPDPTGDAAGETLATGALSMGTRVRRAEVWLGVKYGDEVRPAYLAVPVVYNLSERIALGVWAGTRVYVARGWSLLATYELHRLTVLTDSSLHLVSLGVTWDSAWRSGRDETRGL